LEIKSIKISYLLDYLVVIQTLAGNIGNPHPSAAFHP
jgi:hypothetical protein